jgi:hypothetical protein
LTWGTVPDSGLAPLTAAVKPTSYQDNDPIRRPCLGKPAALTTNPGEEVCNRDGTLGLVLPIPPVDWVPANNAGRNPFPTVAGGSACGGAALGTAAFNVFKCALKTAPAAYTPAGCANGDTTFGGGCIAATDSATSSNTLCSASPLDNQIIGNYTVYDGRIYNTTLTDGAGGYTTFPIPSVKLTTGTKPVIQLPFTGEYGRIHSQTVLYNKANGSTFKGTTCQAQDATDQIGCLAQADPCSVGYAGDNGKTWGARNGGVASNNAALRINQIAPVTTTIQSGAYLLWRKIYLNSSGGFDNLLNTANGGNAAASAEYQLAQYEANTTNMLNLLTVTPGGFFGFGPTGPNGADTPFCEDYNEEMLGCAAGLHNQNACAYNDAGVPGTTTGLAPDASPVRATSLPPTSTRCACFSMQSSPSSMVSDDSPLSRGVSPSAFFANSRSLVSSQRGDPRSSDRIASGSSPGDLAL